MSPWNGRDWRSQLWGLLLSHYLTGARRCLSVLVITVWLQHSPIWGNSIVPCWTVVTHFVLCPPLSSSERAKNHTLFISYQWSEWCFKKQRLASGGQQTRIRLKFCNLSDWMNLGADIPRQTPMTNSVLPTPPSHLWDPKQRIHSNSLGFRLTETARWWICVIFNPCIGGKFLKQHTQNK